MIGKKIGVQSTNTAVWDSFLKANNISQSQVTTVPVQFDPSGLVTGEVDGWFSFITNEPIELHDQGHETTTFLLNDYNYPLVSETYVVQTSSLTGAKRNQLKALLKAEIMGWRDSLKDPTEGATLAVNTYGKSQKLNQTTEVEQSKAQNKLILDSRTKTEGIFTVPNDLIDGHGQDHQRERHHHHRRQAVRHVGADRGLPGEPRPHDRPDGLTGPT